MFAVSQIKKTTLDNMKKPQHLGIQISDTVVLSTKQKKNYLRRPGIEPGSTAWKAAMLTTIPPTP